jgi:glucan phosphoethanolaminetransferase (alkaline phosphatase superfamily)
MLNYNATNGTTIIITLLDTDAGNINNTLLPTPMPIIATTGLLYCIIAWITGFYTLRNAASSPNNFFNLLSTSTNYIIFY